MDLDGLLLFFKGFIVFLCHTYCSFTLLSVSIDLPSGFTDSVQLGCNSWVCL